MIVAALLLGYACLLSTVGAARLRAAAWVERAPRLGVAAWLALIASIISAAISAGVAVAVPAVLSGGLAAALRACTMMLRAGYAAPGGLVAAVVGAIAAMAVAGRALWCTVGALLRAARDRRRHRQVLALIGHTDRNLGAVVVEHDIPAAYCLPGRHRRVVLTTAALSALSAEQLAAVLAHERAHLRGRHGLLLALADGVGRAFPAVPAFAAAREQLARLVELLADDQAARRGTRLQLAEALLTLASTRPSDSGRPLPLPLGTLAATGSAAAQRVRRLLGARRPLGLAVRTGGGVGTLMLPGLPLAVLAAPALAAMQMAYCVANPWTAGAAGALMHPMSACQWIFGAIG